MGGRSLAAGGRSAGLTIVLAAVACAGAQHTPARRYDVIIRGGTIYDGSGGAGVAGDLAIAGDRVAAVGDLHGAHAALEIDARGQAVAPGFVNMLSWATDSLLQDGRSQSDIRQGVTLEVMGEGWSMGPLNDRLKKQTVAEEADFKYDVTWTTLGQYLDSLVARGISPNVASFVGATTVRKYVVGEDDRRATPAEMEAMRKLVAQAMEEGALGVGSSLIYAPAFFADTAELTELAKVAAGYGGMYITHMRSESGGLIEAIDEVLAIARGAGIRAEIYHLKAAGRANWPKLEAALQKIEEARRQGLAITADMYPYTAAATGLDATMPPWVHAGGHDAWMQRLRDPRTRARVAREMVAPPQGWENMYLLSGPDGILLTAFKNPALRGYLGKTLAQVARERGKEPAETAMDLIVEDDSRVGAVFFLMDEAQVNAKIARPWVSFGSDAGSIAPEGLFLTESPHPRAYGTFARLLGKYVREEKVIPLGEAIRRLSALPADNLRLAGRGRLVAGAFADVVVFDPATIADHATYEKPHQYSTGVRHVFVNGVQVLKDGDHTGAKPGRVLRGPGWRPGR